MLFFIVSGMEMSGTHNTVGADPWIDFFTLYCFTPEVRSALQEKFLQPQAVDIAQVEAAQQLTKLREAVLQLFHGSRQTAPVSKTCDVVD